MAARHHKNKSSAEAFHGRDKLAVEPGVRSSLAELAVDPLH
jgi:hypothetical protein